MGSEELIERAQRLAKVLDDSGKATAIVIRDLLTALEAAEKRAGPTREDIRDAFAATLIDGMILRMGSNELADEAVRRLFPSPGETGGER